MEVLFVSHAELAGKRPITGSALAKRVKKTSPAVRASLAAWIARGEVSITGLTTTQTALLTGLSAASVSLVKNASDEDLAALRAGRLSLRGLRAKVRKPKPNGGVPTINDIIDFISVADAKRVQMVINAFADFATAAE
jgi:hypothetical protein